MQRLFHAFPRPRQLRSGSGAASRCEPPGDGELTKGLELLRLILEHGLLCAPERFPIYPDPVTDRPDKRRLLETGEPQCRITQSRACFTLAAVHELAEQYEVSPGCWLSHADLFGPFAIGLDCIEARRLGVLPAVYSYSYVHADDGAYRGARSPTLGLGDQIVHRLSEAATVFSILSHIEARARLGDASDTLDVAGLTRHGIDITYEDDVRALIGRLPHGKARELFGYFDTDRVASWNIVDFLHLLLSLFQTVDARDGTALAHFQQREWRLIYHSRAAAQWFSLGDNLDAVDPLRHCFRLAREELCRTLNDANGCARSPEYLARCWVLNGVEEARFRDFVREIVVPETCIDEVRRIVRSVRFRGEPPRISILPRPWRIGVEHGAPRVYA